MSPQFFSFRRSLVLVGCWLSYPIGATGTPVLVSESQFQGKILPVTPDSCDSGGIVLHVACREAVIFWYHLAILCLTRPPSVVLEVWSLSDPSLLVLWPHWFMCFR